MTDIGDLRKAFERVLKKEEETAVENEQKLLKQITLYLSKQKGASPIQGYKPEEVAAFLDRPISEIRACLGDDWNSLDDSQFENLVYTLYKKVQKSDLLTNW